MGLDGFFFSCFTLDLALLNACYGIWGDSDALSFGLCCCIFKCQRLDFCMTLRGSWLNRVWNKGNDPCLFYTLLATSF